MNRRKRFCRPQHNHSATQPLSKNGAGNEARTRYLNLGKVALYQMSYSRTNIYGLITFFKYINIDNSDKKAAIFIPYRPNKYMSIVKIVPLKSKKPIEII